MSTPAIPSVQKAWRVVRRGSPSSGLVLSNDVNVKKPHPGEVVVRVEAAALNPVGYKLMGLLPNFLTKRPHIAEGDFSGVVVDANGSTEFKEGDAVMGLFPFPQTDQGALATYTVPNESQIVHRPSTLSAEEAAGYTLVTLTAYESLVDIAKIEEGQSIFVNGGSSSIGIAAIQIAKAYGCKVTTSCSTKNIDFVKSLGADEVIDYTTGPLHEQLSARPPTPRFHVIYDSIGSSDLFTHSTSYLAPSGLYLLLGSPVPNSIAEWKSALSMMFEVSLRPRWLGGTNRKSKLFLMNMTKKNLKNIAKLAEEGKVRSIVDSAYSFEDALSAYDRIMTSRARGKVVVKIA